MFCWWRGIFFWPLAALAGLFGYEAIKNTELNPVAATAGTNGAVEILKARYARGEITKTEFDRIRKDIS
jgi:uncharacterized membrane protein